MALLIDYAKFFDTVDLEILIDKLIDNGYPLHEANMSLQQHMAPRILQCEGFSSQPIVVHRSIIAGDMQSVDFTRNYLSIKMFCKFYA